MVTTLDDYLAANPDVAPRRGGTKSEHVLQIACKQWLSEALPPEVVWTAVDHGSYFGGGTQSGVRMWARLKSRGVKTGIPDFHFWWRGIYLAVELKAAGGKPSEDETAWIIKLQNNGFLAFIAWSVSDLERHLREAGFPVRTSAKGIDERLAYRETPKPARKSGKSRQPRPSSKAIAVGARFQRP